MHWLEVDPDGIITTHTPTLQGEEGRGRKAVEWVER